VPALYYQPMLGSTKHLASKLVQRAESIMVSGFSRTFVLTVELTMAAIGAIAIAQRPAADWPICLAAMAVAFSPSLLFFFSGIRKHEGPALWFAWTAGTAILLFATSTPIAGDFAPLLLSLNVGVVTALTSVRGGLLTAASAWAVLLCAAALNRIDTPPMYLMSVAIGLVVGYLVRTQQLLLIEQHHAQQTMAEHAAADERRRIAREVHDVIAHSLSITLLHLTGARLALEHDRDDADAVAALQRAEYLGRQAMADIRRTVGLLAADNTAEGPEPGIADISCLAEDFTRAGMNVTLDVDGRLDDVSPAIGLALYRIAQESLANVAKHARKSPATVALTVSPDAASITVVNRIGPEVCVRGVKPGNGWRGMRQRIELLGGTIDIGPCADSWLVHACIPAITDPSEWMHGMPVS
jgi:signal transduction histidine kinase